MKSYKMEIKMKDYRVDISERMKLSLDSYISYYRHSKFAAQTFLTTKEETESFVLKYNNRIKKEIYYFLLRKNIKIDIDNIDILSEITEFIPMSEHFIE